MNRLQRIVARIIGLPVPSRVEEINAAAHAKVGKPLAFDVERQILDALKRSGMIPTDAEPVVTITRPHIKPPYDPVIDNESWTWQKWQACMNDYQLEGWSPCRFGNRRGATEMAFVFGCTKGEFGIWSTPMMVCDEVADTEMESAIVTALTFLPSGLGVGLFHDIPTAGKAADLIAPILHGMIVDDNEAGEADWFSRKTRTQETLRFHGIREDETRHAHQDFSGNSMPIWRETAANMLEGKPEKLV